VWEGTPHMYWYPLTNRHLLQENKERISKMNNNILEELEFFFYLFLFNEKGDSVRGWTSPHWIDIFLESEDSISELKEKDIN